MNDQIGGQGDKDSTPEAGPDAPSGPTLAAPAIQGEASETPPEKSAAESAPAQPAAAEPTPVESAPAEPAATESPRKKGRLLRPLAALLAVGALGGAGYFGWSRFVAPIHAPTTSAPNKTTAALKAPEGKPSVEEAAAKSATAPLPPAAEAQGVPPKSAAAPEAAVKTAETKASVEAAPEKTAPAAEPAAAEAAGAGEATKQAAVSAEKEKASTTKAAEAKTPAPAAEVAKDADAAPKADQALADMTARLDAAHAALERLGQRLQAVEGQLATPKTDTRAPLAAREAGLANGGDASAKIVVAQSLLNAVRQGDDYAPMLAALQSLDSDPGRIARLRAGLSAPSAARVATDFATLAPKIIAASVPPESPELETKAPQNLGETVLAFVETRAKKLVRIRSTGAPDGEALASRVDRIEKDLARGDLAAALAERAQLPAPALALSADWASGAQARLDAEEAAKAELNAALQALTKSKS